MPMARARIVGLTVVRDEDFYVEQAVRNVAGFCDEVIVLEHRSIDATPEILARLATEDPRIRVHRIRDLRRSHDFVAAYAGEPAWILGFDGDQLFDPDGLEALRPRVLADEFADFWTVPGCTLHCTVLGPVAGEAHGYHAPPSRGTPKLLNFGAIEAWEGPTRERLHGGTIRFRPGYDAHARSNELQELGWDETPLRSLHLCFLRRSSRRPEATRLNPTEAAARRPARARLRRTAERLLRRPEPRQGKLADYSRGPLAVVDARPFLAASRLLR
jgi:hypothetical protein